MSSTPLIFKTKDDTYRVLRMKQRQTSFKEGYAYVLSDMNRYVYPYRGIVDGEDEVVDVGIYIIKPSKFYLRFPFTKEERIIYDRNNIIELSPDVIFKDLNDMVPDPYIDENNSTDTDIFKPQIKQTDDMALAGMKYAIGEKNISFHQYAHKFSDIAMRNNSRRMLTHGNSLKCEMANRFCDVFDINIGMVFWDKKGCRNPADPEYNTVFAIFNDEPLDFKDPNLKFVTVERDV